MVYAKFTPYNQVLDKEQAALLTWKGWYSLRRFHDTDVTMNPRRERRRHSRQKAVLLRSFI